MVHDTPVKELLLALARDAKLNIDIHPELTGTVTLNAIDQPLSALLDRIAQQVNLRWKQENGVLRVEPDTPFWRQYSVDYPNLSREMESTITIETQVASGSQRPGSTSRRTATTLARSADTTGALSGDLQRANRSRTEVINRGQHQFWQNLRDGLQQLIGALAPSSSSTTPAPPTASSGSGSAARSNLIVHPETGIVMVYATARQHEAVQRFLDQLVRSARRQVMIEATVVEVELNDQYQQGISWDLLHNKNSTFRFRTAPNIEGNTGVLPGGTSASGIVPSMGSIEFLRPFGSNLLDFSVQLLQSFGKTKVLSSPKLSVLNNQTAVLKVVENRAYFTLVTDYDTVTSGTGATRTLVISSELNTVPIGLVMPITPQISPSGEIILNLRPTLSRLIGYIEDPAVALNLAIAGVNLNNQQIRSRVPEIQTREIESVIRVRDGDIAVLGGLMREESGEGTDSVPGVTNIPLLGELFRYRNSTARKSELVIFLRPRLITDPSLRGSYQDFVGQLPTENFFRADPPQPPQPLQPINGAQP